jgi:hypothetical protein
VGAPAATVGAVVGAAAVGDVAGGVVAVASAGATLVGATGGAVVAVAAGVSPLPPQALNSMAPSTARSGNIRDFMLTCS